ncbi:amidohydrolase family protein [Sphingomonas alba]|uniref:Amidohydrolase family protein n=1 Tax=Sphingomonas alba TaxID=2908208 RepID=A0ABT0RIB2_9SPHN|nr:amidohydrolase family protein [Sphingomonas alba]MCL6682340.1 amidohydrolase family protein [Sphingomonas alba]
MIRSALAALLITAAAPLSAQSVAIVGGTVALGDGSEPIQNANVVIRNGKIVGAGYNYPVPRDAEIIDARGKWVTPGIVAGFSRLGLAEVDLSMHEEEGAGGSQDTAGSADDSTPNGPFSAAIDVVPAINPLNTTIAVNRADGVTRAVVAPNAGRSIFAGQGAVIDLGADMDPVTARRRFQFVELGQAGAEHAGGSRASAHVLFRNALREASELQRYAVSVSSNAIPEQGEDPVIKDPNESRLIGPNAKRSEDVMLTRFDAAALVPVLQGKQYLLVHVERASDILQVLRLKREFPNLKLVIVGATEGWTVADKIAASGIPVIASAANDLPASFEQLAATWSNVGRMRNAGVKVSIGMIDDNDTRYLFNERQYAGNLVGLARVPGATAVSWGDAMAMLTSAPAAAVGLEGQIGSLKAGRRGDVVIWNGDPLEMTSNVDAVWIDGVKQPLETRQTKLRDRYRDLTPNTLPEAYRR